MSNPLLVFLPPVSDATPTRRRCSGLPYPARQAQALHSNDRQLSLFVFLQQKPRSTIHKRRTWSPLHGRLIQEWKKIRCRISPRGYFMWISMRNDGEQCSRSLDGDASRGSVQARRCVVLCWSVARVVIGLARMFGFLRKLPWTVLSSLHHRLQGEDNTATTVM